MSQVIIKVENLGKLYKLGEIGTGTLSHDLNRWFAKVRGKEDPFAKVGEANDRTKKGKSDYVWALKDINFEIKQGDVVGIIGRNGAGKSTLLKLLSKVTRPSEGEIKINGRIASLLEVGTGFHPELTGRENIFLNGAILGMSKREIKSKFDEIIDFAGIERYIDTPVKRYSSGMYVRLAFAVAAFLEPEILIVDEVLAVGDAEFQRKCLGRMKDVSVNDGRTVLFVSHNMGAVDALCNNGILMHQGRIGAIDSISKIIKEYVSQSNALTGISLKDRKDRIGNGVLRYTDLKIIGDDGVEKDTFLQGESMHLKLKYVINDKALNLTGSHFTVNITDDVGNIIFSHTNKMIGVAFEDELLQQGEGLEFIWKNITLKPGKYYLYIDAVLFNQFLDCIENVASINIIEGNVYNYIMPPISGITGIQGDWKLI